MEESYRGAPDAAAPYGNALYGEGKRVGELISTLFAKEFGFEAKIARLFALVGPYLPLDAHFAMGNFIRDAINRRTIVVEGNGTPYRSYMYAADFVLWLLAILFKGVSVRPYNVGSDSPISILELAEKVASYRKPPLDVRVMKPRTCEPPSRYVPSIKRAKEEMGLDLCFGLEEAISAMMRWHECGPCGKSGGGV
jgi:dTDP-glucose 4,6-dehydratase